MLCVYIAHLKDKYGNIDIISTFSELEIGSVIRWGRDDSEPDGIRVWTVTDCNYTEKTWEN